MTRLIKFKSVSILVLLFLACGMGKYISLCSGKESSLIGHSLRMMKTAGFWISRHSSPDAVIMGTEAIDQFNARLRGDNELDSRFRGNDEQLRVSGMTTKKGNSYGIKLTKDIFTLIRDLKTASLLEDLEKTLSDIAAKGYYTAAGVRGDRNFMEDVKRNMNLSGVVIGVAPRYGLVAHYASQRFLPTKEGL